MCSDLVYVILFPQLLMVVHFKNHCNTYGSLAAYIVAFLVRLTGGEPVMGLPPLIHYPGYDYEGRRQMFPFRTMAMSMSLITLIGVSWWTKYAVTIQANLFAIRRFSSRWVFETGRLAPGYDVFRCVVNIPEDVQRVEEPSEVGEQMSVLASGLSHGNFVVVDDNFEFDVFGRNDGENVWSGNHGREGRNEWKGESSFRSR